MNSLILNVTRAFSIILLSLALGACGGPREGTTTLVSTPPTLFLSAASTSIAYNSSTDINWSSPNTTLCSSSSGTGGTSPSGTFNTGPLTTTTTYTVTCSNADGNVSQSITITVGSAGAPTVSVTSGSTLIASGANTTVSWTSTNSTSCTSTGGGGAGTSGSFNTGALTSTTSYTVTCSGAGGSASKTITINVASSSSITDVANAWATEPMRGTVYYYCDCGTGAQAGCVAGNNTNPGTSPSAPRQTIASAASRFGSLAVNDTVALCKGGAFNAGTTGMNIGSSRCTTGVACNDLREYTPTTFAGTNKPIINFSGTGSSFLFTFDGNGGVRILNIALKGLGAYGNGNFGFFIYGGAHDVTVGNVDISDFSMGVYNESNAGNNDNINFTGNNFIGNTSFAYLGSSDNSALSYNYFVNNGGSVDLDHSVYLAAHTNITNFDFSGNNITGQYGTGCYGAMVEGHISVTNLTVNNNYISVAPSAWHPGCYGMEFNNETDDSHPVYHDNSTFSGNTIINGGNTSFNVSGCNVCTIENNLIVLNKSDATKTYGMRIPINPVRSGGQGDHTNTAVTIRNNTIYFNTLAADSGTGIEVGTEGAGYIVTNNSVSYMASSTGSNGNFHCYKYDLTASSYAAYSVINNNHCYVPAAGSAWVYNGSTEYSLATWQALLSNKFDQASFMLDPVFKSAGTDFRPDTGSPLIGTGNNTYKSSLDLTGATRPSPPSIGAFEP